MIRTSVCAFLLCAATMAAAQTARNSRNDAGMKPGLGQSFVPMNPAVAASDDAMKRMMQTMAAPMTGDADQDFAARMLPHHQGAVDLARVELKYGTDPQLRQLATRIIASKTEEIAFLQAWTAKHKPSSNPKIDNPRIQYK